MQYKKRDINDKIIEAGKAEYFDKGFRAGNISTIAANAGVPVGNLYRYFDGKNGLLDAIVKPAYNEVPRAITDLAQYEKIDSMSLEQIMPELIAQLLNVFDKFGTEILILVDKCASTRYEDFSDNIVKQVSQLIAFKLYGEKPSGEQGGFSFIISKAFVNCLFDILRSGMEREAMQETMYKVLAFFFFEVDKRK